MSLHKEKKFPWLWIIVAVIGGFLLLMASCDFQPKIQSVEKIVVHTVD